MIGGPVAVSFTSEGEKGTSLLYPCTRSDISSYPVGVRNFVFDLHVPPYLHGLGKTVPTAVIFFHHDQRHLSFLSSRESREVGRVTTTDTIVRIPHKNFGQISYGRPRQGLRNTRFWSIQRSGESLKYSILHKKIYL